MSEVRVRYPAFLAATALLSLLSAGCGAAYYGTAIAIVASQEDTETTDTSFPDALPTDPGSPSLAELIVSLSSTTVVRDGVEVTGQEVTEVRFLAGFGFARSNRDAGQVLNSGDRLVIQVNGDTPQELAFGDTDVASLGSQVANVIQTKVRALTPATSSVSALAYTEFSATYDAPTGSYLFVSGAPGSGSAVVFEPSNVTTGAQPDTASAATAEQLGLGTSNGAIERAGDQNVGVTVINRGEDVIPEGTLIDLYLSTDKELGTGDVMFEQLSIGRTIAVGEAFRVLRDGSSPRVTSSAIFASELPPGRYFLIFDVQAAGGETNTSNNTLVGVTPVDLVYPADNPLTSSVETAADLDFAITGSSSPISVVTGRSFQSRLTLTNLGAGVSSGGEAIDVDVILSSDAVFDEPAVVQDSSGALAGVRINPTNPINTITISFVLDGSATAVSTSVIGTTITVSYPSAATVQDLIDALNASNGGLVDAFSDGNGVPASDLLSALLNADGRSSLNTGDVLLGGQTVTFTAGDQLQRSQSFSIDVTVRETAFQSSVLPRSLFPLYRIRPASLSASPAENSNNNTRQAANYVRVFSSTTATFDSSSGAFLPTENAADFALLEAVTQRPVNTGSIQQGQQRVFAFEIPATGLTFDESQLLVTLRSTGFDAHLDLLGATGEFIIGSDDGPLGLDPTIYLPVQSSANSRTFYLVVAPARFDESDLTGGGETFELTISVSPRQVGSPGPVLATDGGDVLSNVPARVASGQTELRNDVLIPYSLENGRAEVLFVLPERARVRLRSQPVATVGVEAVVTVFRSGAIPTLIEEQAVLDASSSGVVYRPAAGGIETFHVLEGGVYTVAFDANNDLSDTQDFRLEVETLFLTDTGS